MENIITSKIIEEAEAEAEAAAEQEPLQQAIVPEPRVVSQPETEPETETVKDESEEQPADTEMPLEGSPDGGEVSQTELPENEVTEMLNQDVKAEVQELQHELESIKVTLPTVPVLPIEQLIDISSLPESYTDNTPKEKLVLAYCENFRRQYVHLYRDRKPLLLCPKNECHVEKFVCTTVNPIKLPYHDLYSWEGAADFVADYLNFVPLEPPCDLPRRMFASSTILKTQQAHCFEYSTLLCSLLIGVGYDAYIISGYATRETCLMDETRETCPLLVKREEAKPEAPKQVAKKYVVRPAKDLRSKFELTMEQRKVREREAEEEKLRRQAELKDLESLKPPSDPLFGKRVHSWVLVLAGKREVPESFFIEPLTGVAHPLNTSKYLGIESLWNHKNYYVNMQMCTDGVLSLKYDLADCTLWEYIFPSNEKPELLLPSRTLTNDLNDFDDDGETKKDDMEKHLDLPRSWTSEIRISPSEFELRCPRGKKTKVYRNAKLEKFAPYFLKDGIVCRLSVYTDREQRDLQMTKEFFRNRADKLQLRVHNFHTGINTEYFAPGRPRHIREHSYLAVAPGPQSDRTILFYSKARFDGLAKRVETPFEMLEQFEARDDFLAYRHAQFGKRTKKFGPADDQASSQRPILKVVERFHRDNRKPADEDIRERIFLLSENKVQLTYHTGEQFISPCTREFIKREIQQDRSAAQQNIFAPESHNAFIVDGNRKQKRNVELYYLLVDLLAAEQSAVAAVRQAEQETINLLNERANEEAISELVVSVYDTLRNEKAKKQRAELERRAEEERKRKQQLEVDYLAPFLAQLGDPDPIGRNDAFRLREACLADLKQRLIDKANLIQARFERETLDLQKRESWYQQNQIHLSKEDEAEYLEFCKESMFRIHILEERLKRHKERAPIRYRELDVRLRNDARLAEFLQ